MAILEDNSVLLNEGPVAQIMLNRPQSMNALNADVFQGLILACEKLQRRTDLRAVTIWGAGDQAFAAGLDVHGIAGLGKRAAAEYFEFGQRALRSIETLPVPVIAALHGSVFGAGLELALACDIIVAAHDVRLGLPEAGIGLIPAFGGIARLLQRVNPGTVKRLVFTGELIGGEEALRAGAVDMVAPPGQLTETVASLVTRIERNAPLALARTKELVQEAVQQQLFLGLRRGAEACLELFQTVDAEEGIDAFLHRHEPKFRGR